MTETTPEPPPPSETPDRATWLSDRALIRVGGAEARAFLNGLVTNDAGRLAEGAPRWAGLLTPQGKALFDFFLWADGPEDVLIDCEAAQADALVRRLSLYRLRRPITIAREDARAVHWSPDSGGRDVADKPVDPRLPALGHRWLAPVAADATTHADSLYRAWRHSHGVPEGLDELGSDQTLWLETNARELNGVDFTKGCYVGQENTARMHYRSKVNRRLIFVPRDRSDPKRQRLDLPEENLALDYLRTENLGDLPVPVWLAEALADAQAGEETQAGEQDA
ncbi:folate-binding protein [Sphingobium sufflavum]|uniref:CAF17-like 4Fe-4S cluster assembly/insertion protein YgfZ n=1 Tax=Sphingobium sufflavum TaxID=1129547 RepID=UPI001F48D2F4|nr:folate-binding protein [Sphingobium sufflavum]MCE7798614.1 folate-binding protein [Sphingobium sufflavum]